ncbi:MAG: hypothetical protein C0483_22555 [Pirellula sp.]|nr:hypothetical protein [Pirellula sp.]
MHHRFIIAAILLVTALSTSYGHSNDADKLAAFMRLKLQHSERILEGIVLEDYKLIEKNAQDLSLLSHDEMWQVFQTPEYLQHSLEFRRAADELVGAARKRNLDGATLAYMGVTLKCVSCHKHVRDVRMAGLEELPAIRLGRR